MSGQKFVSPELLQKRVDILGLQVNRLDMFGALEAIDGFIRNDERRFVVFPNLYCLTHGRRSPEYLQILNSADLTLPDGLPLVWASRLLGQPVGGRVCGPDLFELLNARAAERGYSVYFMGGGGAETVATRFLTRHPDLNVVGTFTPPYGPIEGELNDRILKDVACTKPDLFWVGLGAPRQEQWVARNRERIQARVTLAVGGAFDYLIGSRRRAPVWVREVGLEWGYRISQDLSLIWKKRYYAYLHEFFLPVAYEAARRSLKSSSVR